MLKRELAKIRKNLPQGGQKIIAELTGVTQQHVSLVLNSKRKDHHNIIEQAIELAEKTIKEKEIRKQRVRQKISSL